MRVGLLGNPKSVLIGDRFSKGIKKLETITAGGALQKIGDRDSYKLRSARSGIYSQEDRTIRNSYAEDPRNYDYVTPWSDIADSNNQRSGSRSNIYVSESGNTSNGADLSKNGQHYISVAGADKSGETFTNDRFCRGWNYSYLQKEFTDVYNYSETSGHGTATLYWYTSATLSTRKVYYPQFNSVAWSENGRYLLLPGWTPYQRWSNPGTTYYPSFAFMVYYTAVAWDPRYIVDVRNSVDGKGPYLHHIHPKSGTVTTDSTTYGFSSQGSEHGRDCSWGPNGDKFFIYTDEHSLTTHAPLNPCPHDTQTDFAYKTSHPGSVPSSLGHFFVLVGYNSSGNGLEDVTDIHFYPRFASGTRYQDLYGDMNYLLRISKNGYIAQFRVSGVTLVGSQRCTHTTNPSTLRDEFHVTYEEYDPSDTSYIENNLLNDGDDDFSVYRISPGKIYEYAHTGTAYQIQDSTTTTYLDDSLEVGSIQSFWWNKDGTKLYTHTTPGYTINPSTVSIYICPTAYSLSGAYLDVSSEVSAMIGARGFGGKGKFRYLGEDKVAYSNTANFREYRMRNY